MNIRLSIYQRWLPHCFQSHAFILNASYREQRVPTLVGKWEISRLYQRQLKL